MTDRPTNQRREANTAGAATGRGREPSTFHLRSFPPLKPLRFCLVCFLTRHFFTVTRYLVFLNSVPFNALAIFLFIYFFKTWTRLVKRRGDVSQLVSGVGRLVTGQVAGPAAGGLDVPEGV